MDRDGRPGWLPSLGFAFLTFNCGLSVYRSWDGDDPSAAAFVVVAYVSLVVLFRCFHLLEVERRRRRDQDQRLKLGVWGLSTLLTLMFSYKVATMVPLWAQLLVWAMGTFTVVAGFFVFFLARPAGPRGGALTEPGYQPPARPDERERSTLQHVKKLMMNRTCSNRRNL